LSNIYEPAMAAQTQAEADSCFKKIVAHVMSTGAARQEAEKIARENLAYRAGYDDNETRARVERLFKCAHPVFGSIAVNGPPTPEEAFELGKRWSTTTFATGTSPDPLAALRREKSGA